MAGVTVEETGQPPAQEVLMIRRRTVRSRIATCPLRRRSGVGAR